MSIEKQKELGFQFAAICMEETAIWTAILLS